jgi:hypothetical protein
MPHLFERFHRVRGTRGRTHEGTGIGLALVQELVRLHGGAIRAESAVDRGSTFTVRIPTGTAHLPPDRIGGSRTRASTALGAGPYVEEALRWLPDAHVLPGFDAATSTFHPARRGTAEVDGGRPAYVLCADDNARASTFAACLVRSTRSRRSRTGRLRWSGFTPVCRIWC